MMKKIKKVLLKWILKDTPVELGVGAGMSLGQLPQHMQEGLIVKVQESDGTNVMIKFINKLGSTGAINFVLPNGKPAGTTAATFSPMQARPVDIAKLPPEIAQMFAGIEQMLGPHFACNDPECPVHGVKASNSSKIPPPPPIVIPAAALTAKDAAAIGPGKILQVKEDTTPQFSKEDAAAIMKLPIAMKAIAIGQQHGWTLFKVQPKNNMIQFVNADMKLNVYWTDRGSYTVATAMDHPTKGKTQLFRKGVDEKLLTKIFQNPRVHTQKGYYEK